MDISHPHDSFFHYLVSNVDRAIDLVRQFIPSPLADQLHFNTMKPQPDSFVDSQLKNRYSDALFEVQTVAGTQAYACLLIDHKSAPDPKVIFQLQRYMNLFWERFISNHPNSFLPPIIGIVIYHGMNAWNYETDLKKRFDCHEEFFPYIPHFRYILIDLSTISNDRLHGKADLRAALLLMKYIFHPNLRDYVPMILRVLKEGRDQPDFLAFFEAFLLYLFNSLSEKHHKEVEKTVRAELPIEGGQVMITVADKWKQEGREEGRKEERKRFIKGIQKLVKSKFPDLPQKVQERISSVQDPAILEALMDLAIESQSTTHFQQQMDSIISQ